MNITNLAANMSTKLELSASLVDKSFWEVLLQILKDAIFSQFKMILNLVATIINTVCSWVLSVIDFLFVIVRQLCGINTDFSTFESVQKNDVVLQFITSEGFATVMRNLFMLAVVLIIVFGIIAIIRSEYDAIKDTSSSGDIKNDKSDVIKSMLQSFALLILVPIVLIGSIILSNGVLQTLYRATTGGVDISIGTQIYLASTYDANKYRIYAKNNEKIPITYNFHQINDYSAINDYDNSVSTSELSKSIEELKRASEWTQGYTTFLLFYFDEFLNMDDVDFLERSYGVGGYNNYDYQADKNASSYNQIYDVGIRTYKYEYLVNADLVDYQLKTRTKVYLLTAEELFESCQKAGVQTKIQHDEEKHAYVFDVQYNDGSDPMHYISKEGATDEANGAVFVACVQDYYKTESGMQAYYRPINQNGKGFTSEYLAGSDNLVVMRGVFDGDYPTAIRKENGKIVYYRDKLNIPTFSTLIPRISYEMPEGATEHITTKIITGAVKFFTGIDLHDFFPYIYFDIDLRHLFSKSEYSFSVQDGGYFLDYMFSEKDLSVELFYEKTRINIIILVFAIVIIGKKLLAAMFGALKRFVDIMFLYLLYPAAVATIPLFGKSSFGKWVSNMFKKVTAMYGLIIGVNVGLLLVPLSTNIVLFKATDFANLPFVWMRDFSSGAANLLVQLLFILVGINFIFQIPQIVQSFVTGDSKDKSDIVATGETVISEVSSIYHKAADVISGRAILNQVKDLANWVPGSAIVKEIGENQKRKFLADQENAKEAAAKDSFNKAMGGGDSSGGDDAPDEAPSGGGSGGDSGGGAPAGDGDAGAGSNEASENQEANGDAAAPENAEGEAPAEEGGEAKEGEESSEEKSNDATGEGEAPKEGETPKEGGETPSGAAGAGETPKENAAAGAGSGKPDQNNAAGGEQPGSAEEKQSNDADESNEAGETGSESTTENSETAESSQDSQESSEVSETEGSNDADSSQETNSDSVSDNTASAELTEERNSRVLQKMAEDKSFASDIRNYAKIDSEGYKKFIKENNLNDSDKAKALFFNQEKYSGGSANPKQRDKFAKTLEEAHVLTNMKELNGFGQRVANYSVVNSEGYKNYLKNNNLRDNNTSKAKFWNEERNKARQSEELLTKFKSDNDKARIMAEENNNSTKPKK